MKVSSITRSMTISAFAVAALIVASPSAVAAQPGFGAVAKKAKAVLARFDHEPSIREVQNAAARYARVDPGAYDAWVTAASFAYLLPDRVKGLVESDNDDDLDIRTVPNSTNSQSELRTLDKELVLRLDLWWNFSRLVFNPDKIKISREISRLVDQREDILTTVNKIYFARREHQAGLLINPPTDIRSAVRRQLQIDALTADLDALTGGWFGNRTGQKAR